MYGPIIPLTNAMGMKANKIVMVDINTPIPTSSTAVIIKSEIFLSGLFLMVRCTFSMITMASSTKSPKAKISAKSVMRLTVWPASRPMPKEASRVRGIEIATIKEFLRPKKAIKITVTITIESTKCLVSVEISSLAVSPSSRRTENFTESYLFCFWTSASFSRTFSVTLLILAPLIFASVT